MIMDKTLVMHDNANCFDTDDDVDSISLDTKSADADIGEGLRPMVRVCITLAVTGGTNIRAVLQDSADDATFVDVLLGPIVLVAAALAGKVLMDTPLPLGLQRYVRVAFRNVGANTAGKADAFLYSGR